MSAKSQFSGSAGSPSGVIWLRGLSRHPNHPPVAPGAAASLESERSKLPLWSNPPGPIPSTSAASTAGSSGSSRAEAADPALGEDGEAKRATANDTTSTDGRTHSRTSTTHPEKFLRSLFAMPGATRFRCQQTWTLPDLCARRGTRRSSSINPAYVRQSVRWAPTQIALGARATAAPRRSPLRRWGPDSGAATERIRAGGWWTGTRPGSGGAPTRSSTPRRRLSASRTASSRRGRRPGCSRSGGPRGGVVHPREAGAEGPLAVGVGV